MINNKKLIVMVVFCEVASLQASLSNRAVQAARPLARAFSKSRVVPREVDWKNISVDSLQQEIEKRATQQVSPELSQKLTRMRNMSYKPSTQEMTDYLSRRSLLKEEGQIPWGDISKSNLYRARRGAVTGVKFEPNDEINLMLEIAGRETENVKQDVSLWYSVKNYFRRLFDRA